MPVMLAFMTLAIGCSAFGSDTPPPPTPVASETPAASEDPVIKKLTEALAAQGVTGVTISKGNGMSDIDFHKIMNDLAAHGVSVTLRADVTGGLGLAYKGKRLVVRQDVFMDDSGTSHFIAKLERDRGYVMCIATKEMAYDYRLDKDRLLVVAVSVSPRTGVKIIQDKDAKKTLDAEWQFWASLAGQLPQ